MHNLCNLIASYMYVAAVISILAFEYHLVISKIIILCYNNLVILLKFKSYKANCGFGFARVRSREAGNPIWN